MTSELGMVTSDGNGFGIPFERGVLHNDVSRQVYEDRAGTAGAGNIIRLLDDAWNILGPQH